MRVEQRCPDCRPKRPVVLGVEGDMKPEMGLLWALVARDCLDWCWWRSAL